MIYPELLQNIINFYKKLPGVGDKSAERMALSTLEISKDDIDKFTSSLSESKEKLHNCKICGHITDEEICHICSNPNRNHNLICVIEDYKSVFSFEKVGNYQGVYHVLNGLISPIEGVGPDDIELSKLIDRIESTDVSEIILALKPSIEGETTMQYIKKILSGKDIKISKIATGVPIGTDMEYIDSLTLEMAIDERKNMN